MSLSHFSVVAGKRRVNNSLCSLILFLSLVTGCTAYKTLSLGEVEQNKSWNSRSVSNSSISVNEVRNDDVTIIVKPYNEGTKLYFMILPPLPLGIYSPPQLGYFVIGFLLRPESREVEFNPARISFLSSDSRQVFSEGYKISTPRSGSGGPPGTNAELPIVEAWDCFYKQYRDNDPWPREAFEQLSNATPLQLRQDTCVWVVFDVSPPKPEAAFVLRIDGLGRSGSPMAIPSIYFKKASVWGGW
jgi:hypothetical protein